MGARGAGNSACQFSKMGFCLSKLPSNQNSESLPTKVGVKWVSTAKCQIFLFRLGILSQKLPLSDVKTHNIIARKIYFAVSEFQESLFQGKQISGASFPL